MKGGVIFFIASVLLSGCSLTDPNGPYSKFIMIKPAGEGGAPPGLSLGPTGATSGKSTSITNNAATPYLIEANVIEWKKSGKEFQEKVVILATVVTSESITLDGTEEPLGLLGGMGGSALGQYLGGQVGEGTGKYIATKAGSFLGKLSGKQAGGSLVTVMGTELVLRTDAGDTVLLRKKSTGYQWKAGSRARIVRQGTGLNIAPQA